MEYKIINNENIQVTLVEDENEVAKATCYFKNTPKVSDKNIGTIGEFETNNVENGIKILKKCEEILKEKGVRLIVAPMNGNTWKKYRTLKYSKDVPEFLLENVNPIEHNEILSKSFLCIPLFIKPASIKHGIAPIAQTANNVTYNSIDIGTSTSTFCSFFIPLISKCVLKFETILYNSLYVIFVSFWIKHILSGMFSQFSINLLAKLFI